MSEQQEPFHFEGFAIIEFMGHRKRAGKVRTAEIGGTAVFVVETPASEGALAEVYAASALYCLTPVSEEAARLAASHINPEPISRWELPARVQSALRRVEQEEREQDAALEAGGSGFPVSMICANCGKPFETTTGERLRICPDCRCPRCKGTGGILIDEGEPGDPQPGPCPDCCGTGVKGGICDEDGYYDDDGVDDGEEVDLPPEAHQEPVGSFVDPLDDAKIEDGVNRQDWDDDGDDTVPYR